MQDSKTSLRVSILCSVCAAAVYMGEELCAKCGRRLTKDELRALQTRWEAADPEAARNIDRVHYSRIIITVVAGITAVYGLFLWSIVDFDAASVLIALSIGFLLLVGASFRWPFVSIAVATTTYLLVWLVQLFLNPLVGTVGLIGKTLVLIGLISGCGAELRTRRARRKLVSTTCLPTSAG
jgi:hypothetical protein